MFEKSGSRDYDDVVEGMKTNYEDIVLRRSESSDFDGVVGEGKHL